MTRSDAVQDVSPPCIADDFGCSCIGIQYQQGSRIWCRPATWSKEYQQQRPAPVTARDGKRILYQGQLLVHYNEVDQPGLDGLMTYRVHKAMGQPVETRCDVRWGDWDQSGTVKDYVWVYLISGAIPPAHIIGGWAARRATAGGHVFPPRRRHAQGHLQAGRNRLVADLRRKRQVEDGPRPGCTSSCRRERTPVEETTSAWPIMHVVTASAATVMARHKSNHIRSSTPTAPRSRQGPLLRRGAQAMGMEVFICGTRRTAGR